MVCLRNISVDTLHKGDTEDNNNNNNNNNYNKHAKIGPNISSSVDVITFKQTQTSNRNF
jgi:hypothetical protein